MKSVVSLTRTACCLLFFLSLAFADFTVRVVDVSAGEPVTEQVVDRDQ